MSAGAVVKRIGGPDTGHIGAVCAECATAGRPYPVVWHSRRTVEGRRLAERDRDDHNRARHGATFGGEGP